MDMRSAMLKAGFKESPVALVDRLYKEYQQLEAAANGSGKSRMATGMRTSLALRITDICTARKIGNPLLGQPIEYEEEYMKQCGQKRS